MTNTCGATYSCCSCGLEPHAPDVPHKCYEENCGGSWNWVDGEFVVVELPIVGDILGMLMNFGGSVRRGGIRHDQGSE